MRHEVGEPLVGRFRWEKFLHGGFEHFGEKHDGFVVHVAERRLDPTLREAGRKAAEDDDDVPGLLRRKLDPALRDAVAAAQTRDLMAYAASYEGGAMAKYFALALFAGLRSGPDGELLKLARHPERAKLLDLARGVIHVQPEISKTHQYRQTSIRPALHQWLTRFEGEIWPPNADRMVKHIRARFDLAHDVLRHSLFSYVVGAEKSVERAALEGGTPKASCAVTTSTSLPPTRRKTSGASCRRTPRRAARLFQ